MPARRLDDTPLDAERQDVFGVDVSGLDEFIGHVGLIATAQARLQAGDRVEATDLQPPLVRRAESDEIHALGTAGLTPIEIAQVQIFIDTREAEYDAAQCQGRSQYVVLPHRLPIYGAGKIVTAHRFSCAGFVLEAYRAAGVNLLETTVTALPAVSLELLLLSFSDPQQHRVLNSPGLRDRYLGLVGDGPWPVVMPGYLLNSLARSQEQIRQQVYLALSGDEYFPPRRSDSDPE